MLKAQSYFEKNYWWKTRTYDHFDKYFNNLQEIIAIFLHFAHMRMRIIYMFLSLSLSVSLHFSNMFVDFSYASHNKVHSTNNNNYN